MTKPARLEHFNALVMVMVKLNSKSPITPRAVSHFDPRNI